LGGHFPTSVAARKSITALSHVVVMVVGSGDQHNKKIKFMMVTVTI
jgi:hypothetical protein